MIASLRGLLVLAALTLALAIVVAVDVWRHPAPVDRAVVHLDPAKVQRLAWPELVATREGDAWKTGGAVLDRAAIGDVLRTLEAATWHRRGGTPGHVRTTLQVDRTTIGIAGPLPGADQTWLVVDGTPELVDGWVARALDPPRLALYVLHPFASATTAGLVAVGELRLHGHPRMLETGQIADTAAVAVLERALADAEVLALGGAHDPGAGTEIVLDTVVARTTGACDAAGATVALAGTYGPQCIARASWDRIVAAARAATAVERQPVWFVPVAATLGDGSEVDLRSETSRPLFHALVTSAGELAQPGALPELAHLTIRGARGEHVELRVRPHDLVERAADGAVLHVVHADWLALQAPASGYADPTRWSEDPTAVDAIGIAGVTYRRGAVLGEWTPAGPLVAPALNELAAALASVRARDAAPAATPRRLTVTLAPPVGPPITHALELGAKCAGRIDGAPVTFEPATCTALERAAK